MAVQLSAYCYCNRAVQYDMPFEGSIRSFSDVCSTGEVVVVTDPRFKDGTLDALKRLEASLRNVRVITHEWDLSEPGCDGLEKAYARSQTQGHVLIPFDVDEVVRESDTKKFLPIAENMIKHGHKIIATGVFDWWNGKHIKYTKPLHKPRLTLNDPTITHGIPLQHRRKLPNGKIYGTFETDGAGLIDARTGSPLEPVHSISSPMIIRKENSELLKQDLSKLAEGLLSRDQIWIQHFSWYDIPRKWAMDQTWWYLWHHLLGEYPNGLDDYKVYKLNDDGSGGESVNFWEIKEFRRPLDAYIEPITDQTVQADVLLLKWLPIPKYVYNWIRSPERRVYGERRAKLHKPDILSRCRNALRIPQSRTPRFEI